MLNPFGPWKRFIRRGGPNFAVVPFTVDGATDTGAILGLQGLCHAAGGPVTLTCWPTPAGTGPSSTFQRTRSENSNAPVARARAARVLFAELRAPSVALPGCRCSGTSAHCRGATTT